MKKVGIITLNGYYNYGNRLQNYALQELVKSIGFEVETIINETKFESKESNNIIEKIKNKNLMEISKAALNKLESYLYKNKLNRIRTEIFKEFSNQYINETNFTISENNIPNDFHKQYEYFIVGSDQVWNPYFRKGSPIELLAFAPYKKSISYAASFGVTKIPDNLIDVYKNGLEGIKHISVREQSGAEIVKELTGRNVPVVLDPTMMLTKEKWLSISKVPSHKPKRRYLLTYFLGDIPKERMKYLKEIAKKNDLEIVHLAQIKDKVHYLSGPSEFIDYINSASVFCTDSFHGAVFSILLDTPFIVFDRKGKAPSMNSRIDTLLNKFQLLSRKAENIKSNIQIFEVDYTHTYPILENEREKSIDFLKKSLNVDS